MFVTHSNNSLKVKLKVGTHTKHSSFLNCTNWPRFNCTLSDCNLNKFVVADRACHPKKPTLYDTHPTRGLRSAEGGVKQILISTHWVTYMYHWDAKEEKHLMQCLQFINCHSLSPPHMQDPHTYAEYEIYVCIYLIIVSERCRYNLEI